MKLKNLLKLSVIAVGLGVASANADTVEGYTVNSSGTNWKTSAGECWRTDRTMSEVKDTDCGYEAKPEPAVLTKKLVVAETAGTFTETLNEIISIKAIVLFGFDSNELTNEGKAVLMERINKYKGKVTADIPVEITGHTDSTGPEEYNQMLSEERAQSVVEFIKENTFLTDNEISSKGLGEKFPIAENTSREGRATNRRVDIHFIGKEK